MTPEQKAAEVVNALAVEWFMPLEAVIPRMHCYIYRLEDGSVFYLPPSKSGWRHLIGVNVYYGIGRMGDRCRPVFA